MAASKKWVYFFGNGKAEGKGDQKELLGGKGAGLAEMTRIGLPVPGGFTITTEACAAFSGGDGEWPAGLEKQIRQSLTTLERACKKKLGAEKNPLLVSVRSGAARSMPGMMETILNLGLNDRSVEALAQASDNRRFAFDAYRRFIMMYGSTAMGIERHEFDQAFQHIKDSRTRSRLGLPMSQKIEDTHVDASELEAVVEEFKQIYQRHVGEAFPQEPFVQLRGAINAVFNSWNAEKAVTYRRVENITGLKGTAVNVCQMVFGNMGEDCGTGVCFTRDPSTGEQEFYGDFLINAQGEDVVAGIRTPLKLSELHVRMPEVYEQLEAVRVMLETHYRDMQDLEFTIERGKLYMLQCRTGKRSPQAAFKIAVEQATLPLLSKKMASQLRRKRLLPARYAMIASKPVISREEAIGRISGADVERLFYPVLDPAIPSDELKRKQLGEGIGAVPGAATGEIAFSAEEAELRAKQGASVILVRKETSPEDVGGMYASIGILTATGGKTSHAAVVARGWGKCCIVGCEALNIDYNARTMSLNGRMLRGGDWITLDGGTGRIFEGRGRLVEPQAPDEFQTLLGWCDEYRRLAVRANADTPADAAKALELGAEGIGLCRTEHMFFDPSQPLRIRVVRQMILADTEESRRAALAKLLPFQRDDFEGIFRAMPGKPITIRLIDPPLHEFLPHADNPRGQQEVADELNASLRDELARVSPWDNDARRGVEGKRVTREEIARRVEQLHEANPMLGHRGCRLCVTFPEILEMQVRAIMEAAAHCARDGVKVHPEIMIPLSIDPKELAILIAQTHAVAKSVLKEQGVQLEYLVGTMIETPRAALLAEPMAAAAEFFSFGTNDLTQLTMGLSRDDAGRFLPDYLSETHAMIRVDGKTSESAKGASLENAAALAGPILNADPFQSIDTEGVGLLVRQACESGRKGRPKIKLGVCGEHGGDPQSIRFFEKVGLAYVSCSPLRVPVARLAAAQAAIESGTKPTNRKSSRKKKGASRSIARAKGSKRTPKSSAARSKSKARGSRQSGRTKKSSASRGAGARAPVLV
ncbi:MAG: pyruvate, phosphate dikinase [Planctomycetes bacterium]|nr:pyruvate, phosphate dikinase [Planctomycetota bacterium]MBI3833030.1 pyruvate, phosphate dikinase [Planctomycetota bacterium]